MPVKYNTMIFVEKSIKKHGLRYDYSLVNYIKNSLCVNIICNKHGIFKQRPDVHMRGGGCTKCSSEHKNELFSLKNDDFIRKSKLKHGDKYIYDLVEYENNKTKVKIVCPEHGVFEQEPRSHYVSGCPKCDGTYRSNTKEFIKKSKLKHGDMYDYCDVKYVNAISKVEIICDKHGTFNQTPNNHLSGKGCPICRMSHGETQIRNYLSDRNIDFEIQFRFKDCRNKLPLPFDFYLPKHNLCIEYDGEQHFRENKIWKKLKETQNNDEIKNRYCKENNIDLIRIRYDENVIQILESFFII